MLKHLVCPDCLLFRLSPGHIVRVLIGVCKP